MDCEATFDAPSVIIEKHDEVEGGFTQQYTQCPVCGSDSIEEAVRCEKCGESVAESENLFGICSRCEAAALLNFKSFLAAFALAELKYIDFCIEGVGIVDPDAIRKL